MKVNETIKERTEVRQEVLTGWEDNRKEVGR